MRSPVLDRLPWVGERRLAVKVRPAALRQIRLGHPWVFSDSIRSTSFAAAAGDLAVIFDDERRFVAIGLWDPDSPIRVRILHQGDPQTIDTEWWRQRIKAAIARRTLLIVPPDRDRVTDGYRVINGEGDGFSGLVVDRYAEVAVIKVYSVVWVPWLSLLVDLIEAELGVASIVLRVSRNCADGLARFELTDGMVLAGDGVPDPVWFSENGLEFAADVVRGQKTGYFLDQRENRQRVRELVERSGAETLLDMFSCSGGFSVYGAAGGVRRVVSVDRARPALDAAIANMEANVAAGSIDDRGLAHETIAGDAFTVMDGFARRGVQFDVVVVDPPAFASRQRDVQRALGAYRRLTRAAVELVVPGGTLVQASCSSRVSAEAFVQALQIEAARVGRPLEAISVYGHSIDHPTVVPEGEYLKAVFATV